MSRRRYVSTAISLDAALNRLAIEQGDFAALLYTWMIPHAGDDGLIHGTAEEILYLVMPGRRDKGPAEIDAALRAMHELGLVIWNPSEHTAGFPLEPFYKYQSYIKGDRRRPSKDDAPSENGGANQRKSAQNTEEQREAAQNAASFSLKSSSSFTQEEIGGGGITTNRAPAREEKPSPVESSAAAAVCSALEIDPGSGPGMAVAASITAHPEIDHLDQAAGWKLKNERWRQLSPTDRATRFRHWVGREVSFRAAAVVANGSRASPNGSTAPALREFPDDLPSEPTPLELKRQWNIERANEYRDQHNN